MGIIRVLLIQILISTATQTVVHMLELNKNIVVLMVTADILATLDRFFYASFILSRIN